MIWIDKFKEFIKDKDISDLLDTLDEHEKNAWLSDLIHDFLIECEMETDEKLIEFIVTLARTL